LILASVRGGAAARLLVAAGLLLLAIAPLGLSRHLVDLLTFAGLYTIAGLGVSYLLGQCGIVTLAQSVFYGIGAYGVGYATTQLALPSALGYVAGAVASASIACAVGYPVLRLSGHFLALATLALAVIGQVLFQEWDWLTGGTLGIGGVPKLAVPGFAFDSPLRSYYLVWSVALLGMLLKRNLSRGRNGLALRALRDAPDAAAVAAIDTHALKVKIFVLSAVFGSIAGSLYANYVGFISVDSFGVDRSIQFLLLAVLGGVNATWGPALGALFVTLVPEWMSRFGDIHAVLFAVTLIVAVVFLPNGLAGALARLGRERNPP
jgi:branched-chain amino acid transport system permease protein